MEELCCLWILLSLLFGVQGRGTDIELYKESLDHHAFTVRTPTSELKRRI